MIIIEQSETDFLGEISNIGESLSDTPPILTVTLCVRDTQRFEAQQFIYNFWLPPNRPAMLVL